MFCIVTVWWLGEVETQQVVRFRTVLSITHYKLSSLPAPKTEVLMSVFALQSQLPLLRLQLCVPGFLLFLHHYSTLEKTLNMDNKVGLGPARTKSFDLHIAHKSVNIRD